MILYRLFMALAFPVLLAQAVFQALRKSIPWAGVAERLGGGAVKATKPHLWLHGASLGELQSARALLEKLLAARPGLSVIVTCNTGTARQMVADWQLRCVSVVLAPFDLGWCLGRFIRRWQPASLIVIENELWPARMQAMLGRPIAIIGARISERAANRWHKHAAGLIRQMLSGITLLSAQDAGSEARFLALGLPPAAIGPRLMLKAFLAPSVQDPPFPALVPRAQTVLAASTHEGEESLILDAFQAAQAQGAFRLLIIAPRHPARAPAVRAEITRRGLRVAQRSMGESPDAGTEVYLADTLGEMGRWYSMAGVTIVGGSFGNRGGHTPFEPAAHGSAILHGPDVTNFAEAFAALAAKSAAIRAEDSATLADALAKLNPDRQTQMAGAARDALAADDGLDHLVTAILSMLASRSTHE